MPKQEQLKRLSDINELIELISSLDRRFFYSKSKDRIANFEFSNKGKLFFRDNYTGERIYPYDLGHGSPRKFSHGGTMWEIVQEFAKFITKGKTGRLIDFKETWAYTYESTMKVREKAKDIGYIESTDYPYKMWG